MLWTRTHVVGLAWQWWSPTWREIGLRRARRWRMPSWRHWLSFFALWGETALWWPLSSFLYHHSLLANLIQNLSMARKLSLPPANHELTGCGRILLIYLSMNTRHPCSPIENFAVLTPYWPHKSIWSRHLFASAVPLSWESCLDPSGGFPWLGILTAR